MACRDTVCRFAIELFGFVYIGYSQQLDRLVMLGQGPDFWHLTDLGNTSCVWPQLLAQLIGCWMSGVFGCGLCCLDVFFKV